MRKTSIKIFFITLSFISLNVFAQKDNKERKADKLFNQYSFYSAIELYKKVDSLSLSGQRNLAMSYKNTNQIKSSVETFDNIVSSAGAQSEDYFNYSSVLRLSGDYKKSEIWMSEFKKVSPNDKRAISYENEESKLPNMLKDEGRYRITHLNINTSYQEFGPAYYKDRIVFASTREGVKTIERRYNWNNMPFLDLYMADRSNDQLQNPQALNKPLNKKFHEGPASFNSDGNYMAFTRNNYEDKSKDGKIKLKIFFSSLNKQGEWDKEESFKLNNSEYSVGHPCLSGDGKTMYFSSDMPGGVGGVDVYRIEKKQDGSWGDPINLGTSINTEANEMFPYYREELGVIFFASNGHLGLGGLDVFVSPINGDGKFTKVLNAGAPLNTRFDDFGLIVNENMSKGYFSSNREGGSGDDDIYYFELLKPFSFGKTITGVAKDKNGNVLSGVLVSLTDASGDIFQTATTSKDGKYKFSVDPDKEFKLKGSLSEYLDGNNTANTKSTQDEVVSYLIMEKDPGLSLYALVTDKKTGLPLEGVKITLIDNQTSKQTNFLTPASGDLRQLLFDKKVNDKGSFNIVMERQGYFTKTLMYETTFHKPGQYDIHAKLDLSMDVEVKDLSEMIQINPINFDLNKFNIRADAATELNKIIDVMNKYPNLVVELGSHTDCRATEKYNESLSDKRAKASANYIKAKVTNPERIYGKGYGESKLLNNCGCEGNVKSDCSEEEHAKNRRTEFKVISTGNDKLKVVTGSNQ